MILWTDTLHTVRIRPLLVYDRMPEHPGFLRSTLSEQLTTNLLCMLYPAAVWGHWRVTFRVQQLGEAQVLLSQVESILQVVVSIGLFQLVKVYEVRPEDETQS